MTYPLTKSVGGKQEERWDSKILHSLIGGINTDERPDTLKENQVVDATNLFVYKKELRIDTGYTQLGTGAAVDSMMKRVFDFYSPAAAAVETIGISKGSVYRYNTAQMEWQYVKDGTSTDLNGAFATGSTALTVDSSAGFVANDKIGISLTNGKQHRTTVLAVPDGTHITIPNPGLPSGASDEGIIVKAVVLNGSDSFPVMCVAVPSNGWLVFTNNVDNVKRYNGTDCVDVPGLVNTTCLDVALYNSALFLLGTIEGGNSFPYRVRRSEIGDPTTWAGGTAGFDDLLDTDGFVVGGDILGPYLIVYKGRTIYRGQFVNTGGKFYQFDAMLHGDTAEGLVATDALVNVGPYHIFLGNANVYRYYGDFSLTPIGNEVFFDLFSSDASVSTVNIPLSFGIFVEGLGEVWFFYCSMGASWPDSMIRFNIKTESWTRRKFTDKFVSAGLRLGSTSFTWNDLVGTWADQSWFWNSRLSGSGNRPTIVLCPSTGNQVFVYDFVSAKDNATQAAAVLETRDFIWSGGKLRTDRIEGYLQGLNILIQYSVDQGLTWNAWDIVSSATMQRVQSYKQVTADSLRFRFTCSDPTFRFRWMSLTWRSESVK